MNKNEYMEQLSKALGEIDQETAADILDDYEAHFARAREMGKTEEKVIAELGTIEEFTEELRQFTNGAKKANPQDNAGSGENVQNSEGIVGEAGEKEEYSSEGKESEEASENGQGQRNEEAGGNGQGQESEEAGESSREDQRKEGQEDGNAGEERRNEYHRTRYRDNSFEEEDAQGGGGYEGYSNFGETIGETIEKTLKEAFKAVEAGTKQLKRTFSGVFSEWTNHYDGYPNNGKQQGGAGRAGNFGMGGESRKKPEDARKGGFYSDTPEDGYMQSFFGSVAREEGIVNILVSSNMADIHVRHSPDEEIHYRYVNHGNEGSKIVYRLEAEMVEGTLELRIVKNGKVNQKSHFGILSGVFAENAELSLELQLPDWLECLNIGNHTGNIVIEEVILDKLQVKSVSGDISLKRIDSFACEAGTISGEIEAEDVNVILGSNDAKDILVYLVSKSGDIKAANIYADKKAEICSTSGELRIKSLRAGEAVLKTTSGNIQCSDCRTHVLGMEINGDLCVRNIEAGKVSLRSISGDLYVEGCSTDELSIQSNSGDIVVKALKTCRAEIRMLSGDIAGDGIRAQNAALTTISGDIQIRGIEAKHLSANTASGGILLDGLAEGYQLKTNCGDIEVVQKGDATAKLSSQSGEVKFHLKNDGRGFCGKLNTRGEINIRYKELNLHDAGRGEHRWGMEGSRIEANLVSGDITITD